MKGLVIGLGNIGLNYDLYSDPKEYALTHSRALQLHPFYDLVGGCDIRNAQNETFSKHYNKPSFVKISDAVKETKPDIVCVSVPTKDHFAVIREVLDNSDPSVILCEKPISNSVNSAFAMHKLCKKRNCKLLINFMRKTDIGSIEVKKRISDGQIIGPFKGICWYSKGLLNNGSHFLNLLEFWLGKAKSYKVINKGRVNDLGDHEPDVQITFELGDINFISFKEEIFSYYSIELLASNGRLKYELDGSISWQNLIRDSVYQNYIIMDKNKVIIDTNMNFSQYNVLEDIKNKIKKEESVICTTDEALQNLLFLDKIVGTL